MKNVIKMDDSSDDDKGRDGHDSDGKDGKKEDYLSEYNNKRAMQEGAKKDDYKSLYEHELKRAQELKETLKHLEKRHHDLDKIDSKCDMVEILQEIHKRGGVYKEGGVVVPKEVKKKIEKAAV